MGGNATKSATDYLGQRLKPIEHRGTPGGEKGGSKNPPSRNKQVLEDISNKPKRVIGKKIEEKRSSKNSQENHPKIANYHVRCIGRSEILYIYIYGTVAYLRYMYEDQTFGWILIAASSKVAADNVTIVIKELQEIKLGSELGQRAAAALNIDKKDVFYFVDNTIVLDQIAAGRKKGVNELSRGFGNLIAKIANDIPAGNIRFVPSQFNSADNLTRVRTVEELFDQQATWFKPHANFNQIETPHLERIQWKKVTENTMITTEEEAILMNDLQQMENSKTTIRSIEKEQQSEREIRKRKERFTLANQIIRQTQPQGPQAFQKCGCNNSTLKNDTVKRLCNT